MHFVGSLPIRSFFLSLKNVEIFFGFDDLRGLNVELTVKISGNFGDIHSHLLVLFEGLLGEEPLFERLLLLVFLF